MKKRLIFFLGALCSFGYYSCTKSMVKDSEQVESIEYAARGSRHKKYW
jgi:hypothetical protein